MVVRPYGVFGAWKATAAHSDVLGETKLMKFWTNRRSNQTGHFFENDSTSDVFEQSEKSLLREALGRPLGLGALIIFVLAIAVFAGNHFMWTLDRVTDYALVAFFVAGGILLSLLLRSGEPKVRRPKPNRYWRDEDLQQREMMHGRNQEDDRGEMVLGHHQRQGLAENAPAGSPIPLAATKQAAVPIADSEHDDEVAGYERALLHYVEKGDLHGQGEILRRLGHTAKGRGHLEESKKFYLSSRDCFKGTDDHYAEAAVLLDLGQVLESLGDQDAASVAYRDANRALLDVAMNASNRDRVIHAQAAD